jgi:hypothetical protein
VFRSSTTDFGHAHFTSGRPVQRGIDLRFFILANLGQGVAHLIDLAGGFDLEYQLGVTHQDIVESFGGVNRIWTIRTSWNQYPMTHH